MQENPDTDQSPSGESDQRERVRWDEFDRLARKSGLEKDAEIARTLGISQAYLRNLRTGHRRADVAAKFKAGCVRVWGDAILHVLIEPADEAAA